MNVISTKTDKRITPLAIITERRPMMQFSLAADRILSGFFDPEGLEGRGSDLGPNIQREGRDNTQRDFGT